MIYIVLAIILLISTYLPLRQPLKLSVAALLVGATGVIEMAGIVGLSLGKEVLLSTSFVIFLILTSLLKTKASEREYSAPIAFLIYLALSEVGFIEKTYIFLFSLIVLLILCPNQLKKSLLFIYLPILALMTLRLSLMNLIGPIDPLIGMKSNSNLILTSFISGLLNVSYIYSLSATGIKLIRSRGGAFPTTLFVICNFYFMNEALSVYSYYFVFVVNACALFLYRKNLQVNDILVLVILLIFQFQSELGYIAWLWVVLSNVFKRFPTSVKRALVHFDWRLIGLTFCLLSTLSIVEAEVKFFIGLISVLALMMNCERNTEVSE